MEDIERRAVEADDFTILDEYPCFEQFYEVLGACSDVHIDFFMELHHSRQAINYRGEFTYSNSELRTFPLVYDSPKYEKTKTMTY